MLTIGEPIMSYEMVHPSYEINADLLRHRLNEIDAFDIPITFEENDQLEIVFNHLVKDTSKRVTCRNPSRTDRPPAKSLRLGCY